MKKWYYDGQEEIKKQHEGLDARLLRQSVYEDRILEVYLLIGSDGEMIGVFMYEIAKRDYKPGFELFTWEQH